MFAAHGSSFRGALMRLSARDSVSRDGNAGAPSEFLFQGYFFVTGFTRMQAEPAGAAVADFFRSGTPWRCVVSVANQSARNATGAVPIHREVFRRIASRRHPQVGIGHLLAGRRRLAAARFRKNAKANRPWNLKNRNLKNWNLKNWNLKNRPCTPRTHIPDGSLGTGTHAVYRKFSGRVELGRRHDVYDLSRPALGIFRKCAAGHRPQSFQRIVSAFHALHQLLRDVFSGFVVAAVWQASANFLKHDVHVRACPFIERCHWTPPFNIEAQSNRSEPQPPPIPGRNPDYQRILPR
jgi:hypothetical protein